MLDTEITLTISEEVLHHKDMVVRRHNMAVLLHLNMGISSHTRWDVMNTAVSSEAWDSMGFA